MAEATPMTIPSMVREERRRWAARPLRAMKKTSLALILLLPQDAIPDEETPLGPESDIPFVSYQDNGEPLSLVEVLKELQDILPGAAVQVPRGLIGQEQGGPVYQGPGDVHPLLFPAGKLVGAVVGPLGQPHLLQGLPGQPPPTPFPGIDEGQFYIAQGAGARQEVGGLGE